jgi:HEPN domain-containing protein
MENESKRLTDKSIEAFILGLEVYNKPTIKYRVEGFSFFIVNAWELMLKAALINRGVNIYYKDNPSRTLSIEATVKKIYSDPQTRIRLNLEKVIELRNISTHYITEDYELKYVPLFQACVLNYANEMQRFHGIDVTKYVAKNFLTLSVNIDPLSNAEVKAKYAPEIAEKFIQQANEIDILEKEYHSNNFSIAFEQKLYITKKKKDANFTVAIAKGSKNPVAIVKELKDPSNTHQFSYQTIIAVVSNRLKKENIKIDYDKGFNSYVLNLIMDFYDIKAEPKYAYKHIIGKHESYTYSQQFVDFIVEEIKKDPERYVQSLINSKKKS